MSKLTEQAKKRVESILERELSQGESQLFEILVDIADQSCPTVMWRAPMVVSSMIVDAVVDFHDQAAEMLERASKEGEPAKFMPPEAYVFTFFANCAKAERAMLESGRGLSRKDKVLQWLEKFRSSK